MNLAGALAQLAVAPDQGIRHAIPRRLSEARDEVSGVPAGDALYDFSEALAGGEATMLAALVTPVPIDDWTRHPRPALLRIQAEDYGPMQAPARRVERDSLPGMRLLATRHLEARPLRESIVISPQDGEPDRLTVDLLVPTKAPRGVGLATVSAPALAGRWNEVAAELRERAAEGSKGGPEAGPPECREAIVRGPDNRWVSGCAAGTCKGTCTPINVSGDDGIDSFGCVCRLEPLKEATVAMSSDVTPG
jgi:hypothetical protein